MSYILKCLVQIWRIGLSRTSKPGIFYRSKVNSKFTTVSLILSRSFRTLFRFSCRSGSCSSHRSKLKFSRLFNIRNAITTHVILSKLYWRVHSRILPASSMFLAVLALHKRPYIAVSGPIENRSVVHFNYLTILFSCIKNIITIICFPNMRLI